MSLLEKFARLTGRSPRGLRLSKNIHAPRTWLSQDKRLTEARHPDRKKRTGNPLVIYFDLGFESSSHFLFL